MEKDTKKNKKADNYKKDIKKKPTTKEQPMNMISSTIHSEIFIRVVGTFFILLSVFLMFSFVSFFISWTVDHNIVESSSALDLLKGDKDIKNWGGGIGAFLSYIMIYKTFGIASFGYIFVFIIIGLRLFGIKLKDFSKTILYTFIIMLWLSAIIGFVVYFVNLDDFYELAGIVGISINSWLHSFSGNVGAILILLFFTITLPMIMFGVKYSFINKTVTRISQQAKEKKLSRKELAKKEYDEEASEDIEESGEEIGEESQEPKKKEIEINPTGITKNLNVDSDGLTEEEKEQLLQFELKGNKTQNQSQTQTVSNSEGTYSFEGDPNQSNQPKPKKKEDKDIDFEIESSGQIITQQGAISTLNSLEDDDEKTGEQPLHRNDITTIYDPKADLPSFVFPSTDFLVNYEERNQEVKQEELVANKDRIVNTLKNYNIDISKIVATPGPTVTLYEIVPAPGIRISKIKNLEDDIALSLSALGIRIIAPIPGRGTIGIEVPNQHPQIVSMRTMLNSVEFKECKFELPIALGKTISNKPYVTDLTKMPHLLLAGATGQGKSVGLNAIISSLLYKKHPAELKFVMVDPKKVELSLYTKIERHYLAKLPDADEAIITDTRKVVRTLNSLCIEMDQRYDLLKNAQVKNIKEYNPKFCSRRLNPEEGHRFLPYIVLVIDEFADLIMTAGKEIEMPIARLAQLARAVGIHLIIATQRPSVNIITGIIKANFPVRVAFRVTSKIDSRTILDMGGADQLIGRGDMLISTGNEIIRIQCALIDTEEIEQVAEFIGNQRGYPDTFLLPEYIDETSEPNKDFDPKQIDDKFEEAARLIVALQHGSTSIIQRKLSLGYNRAGRIIDQLEAAGIVGPFEGSKARDVRIKTEIELDEVLKDYLGR
ncbi:MAG: DNA translocase FtsK [Bacteroidales bacterium]|nr:DNA translocase FtsK [Bacteroidales bacterium]MDD4685066.1 DNA translocase FtsK [Bacteroidales bacterium]